MSAHEDEPLDDIESGERDPLHHFAEHDESPQANARPTRSIYALTRGEITRGIANRFVHSRIYIVLYLVMAALSITTVVLSLKDGCPGLAFYVLEVIINATMIGEVVIRFLAFGRQFWKYPFNIFDLIVTTFCALTLLVIVFAGCGAASKEEEILDTLLLVARNVLQFGRLAAVVRQSGQSIFTQPKPIDLSAARRAGYSLDMDLDVPDDEGDDIRAPQARPAVIFDARAEQRPPPRTMSDMPRAAQAVDDRDEDDVWAELG